MTAAPVLRVGIAGMGAAGQAFVPALRAHPGFEWVAFAEPVHAVRERLQAAHGVAAHADLEGLLQHPLLDAVIVATPTPLHAPQVLQCLAAGLHVLVEKPMAVNLADGQAMVAAAAAAGRALLVGHSHSVDAPIAAMRALIAGCELGAVGMAHHWCYTDWLYRPRRPDELETEQGGGVTFRQGSHQFDILRLLCGGRAASVRAKTFGWDPTRPGIGAHTVFIDFADGAAATAVYNGHGGFRSSELCFDIGEWGVHQPPDSIVRTSAAAAGAEQELAAKQARAAGAVVAGAEFPPMFGLTLVSCERGDIRQSARGLQVHTRRGVRELPVSTLRSPRELLLDELQRAVVEAEAVVHDGRWGLANLELCLAAIESSRTGREVPLRCQGQPAA